MESSSSERPQAMLCQDGLDFAFYPRMLSRGWRCTPESVGSSRGGLRSTPSRMRRILRIYRGKPVPSQGRVPLRFSRKCHDADSRRPTLRRQKEYNPRIELQFVAGVTRTIRFGRPSLLGLPASQYAATPEKGPDP